MNEDIVKLAKQEIATLQSSVPKGSHVKTGDIRKSPAILKNDYANNKNRSLSISFWDKLL